MDRTKLHITVDYIILRMDQAGFSLNPVKLQRLIYVAYAWYLAFNQGQQLFPEQFEAWKYGPICLSVRDRFLGRSCFYSPITLNDRWSDDTDPHLFNHYLSANEREHLDLMIEIYGELSAFELEEMLRNEDPWQIARVGLDLYENSSRKIPDDVILAYYKKAANSNG